MADIAVAFQEREIAERVKRALTEQPRLTIRDLELRLRVGRHTIRRHLRRQLGLSFLQLKQSVFMHALDRAASGRYPMERQDLAKRLGCSRRTLLRWLRRSS